MISHANDVFDCTCLWALPVSILCTIPNPVFLLAVILGAVSTARTVSARSALGDMTLCHDCVTDTSLASGAIFQIVAWSLRLVLPLIAGFVTLVVMVLTVVL